MTGLVMNSHMGGKIGRDEFESVITTAERVEVIEIEHDVRKTPSSTYFGD